MTLSQSPTFPEQTPTHSVNGVSQELPPLPKPLTQVSVYDDEYGKRKQSAGDYYYTADQMHAYARAAIAVQSPAASQPVIAATVKRWCETCEGTGYVFQEPQAGCFVGGDHPCPDCDGKGYWTPAQPPAASRPNEEGEREIIATYNALHANKLGAHWLWVVIEQIAAGVPEDEAFKSFGYYEAGPSRSRWDAAQPAAGEVAKDAGWRDIESRPIESRSYLVCNALGHVAPWIDGVIHNAPGSDSSDWEWGEAITHWQPLPAPPVLPTKE